MTSDRTKLLSRMLREKGIIGATKQTIPRRNSNDALVASFLQEGLWFLDQLHPGQATYNVPGAARIKGALDVTALQRTLGEIIRRHETLRTTFREEGGKPYQVISPARPFELAITNLELLPEEKRETEVLRLATEEAQRSFDLCNGPLFRVFLLRLQADEHVLVLNTHHTVTDGWSMGVFTRELFALYEAFSNNRPSPLPELPVQFADFAIWQRRWLHGAQLEKQLFFWRQQLSGELPVLQLPFDRPRPAFQTCRGEHLTMRLPVFLSTALRGLTQREDVTLFELLLAAFYLLLFFYTDQEDLVVGSPAANRSRKEMEGLIGYFVNMLPLRLDLSGNPRFAELLKRIHTMTMGAFAHQDLPFGKLVEELDLARDVSRNPVFQTEFILLTREHAPPVYGYGFRSPIQAPQKLCNLTLTPIEVESGVAKFDLVVLLWDVDEGVSGTFEYNADLFDAGTILKMINNYEKLLSAVVAQPEARLSELKDNIEIAPTTNAPLDRLQRKQSNSINLKKIKRKSVLTN